MSYRYKPLLRPAGFATLPRDIGSWCYVERPTMPGFYMRDDLPAGTFRFGVIQTQRELTADECHRFDLEPVA